MTEAVYVYIKQGAEEILYQLETNLRDAKEVRHAQNIAKQWKERLSDRGFSSLVTVVNREMNHLLSEELTSDDFKDAEVYPNSERMMEYEVKHGLPALSFGVAIPPEKWAVIQRKFRTRATSQGLSLREYGFSEHSLGLDATGLTMHDASGETGYQEFQQLYEDFSQYSRSFRNLAALTLERLRFSPKLTMALLCRTMRDLSAWRYEFSGKKAQENNIRRMLTVYGDSYKAELVKHGAKSGELDALTAYYGTIIKPIMGDIPRAIEAVSVLEERAGPAIVTPLLFALGVIRKETTKYRFYSPLHGIIKAREYIESGELRTEDISEILERKGYRQMACA